MAIASNPGSMARNPAPLNVGADEIDGIYRKITRQIVPLVFLSYLLAFLDRINVGYAQLQMKDALGFSDTVYGFGAGIFFISYLLFEVPSNLLLERTGVRLTLLRIMFLWGLASAATMLVSTPTQFYIIRFLLGAFEAGLFPGIILYLSYWFPSNRRGRVTSQFMFAVPVAGIIGGPLSGWIMSSMNGVLGLGGWQWMFLIEGLPTSVLGIVCYFLLTDTPRQAKWLSPREKEAVEATLASDQSDVTPGHANLAGELRRASGDPRVWILAAVYFTSACAVYTFTFWLPTMIKNLGITNIAQIGLYSFFPYAFAALGILGVGWSSDRQRERRWHLAGCMIMAAFAFSLSTMFESSFFLSLAALCAAGFFNFGASVLYWSVPPTYLGKDASAVGIALISSLGVIGGFLSPTLLGAIKTYTGSLNAGIYFIAALLVVGALVILTAVPARALRVGGLAPNANEPEALPS